MYDKRSRSEWDSIVLKWESNDQTMAAFCRDHSIAPSSFYTARNRIKKKKQLNLEPPQYFHEITDQIAPLSSIKRKSSITFVERKDPCLRMTSPAGAIIEVFL